MKLPITLTAGMVLLACLALPSLAQESPSFRLNEHSLNAGGHPRDGAVASSARFRISLDALGGTVARTGMASPRFLMDAGFVSVYRPPGEVAWLWFQDEDWLNWSPESSAGDYNLYRDPISDLVSLDYGHCLAHDIPATTTVDADLPAVGEGFFYLVTAENRLNQEGPKGWGSFNLYRMNANPCP
jgi:hypothetical protein